MIDKSKCTCCRREFVPTPDFDFYTDGPIVEAWAKGGLCERCFMVAVREHLDRERSDD